VKKFILSALGSKFDCIKLNTETKDLGLKIWRKVRLGLSNHLFPLIGTLHLFLMNDYLVVMINIKQRLFLMCSQSSTSLSHLYIKERRLEDCKRLNNNLLVPKICWNCCTTDLFCEHHWLYIKCSTSNTSKLLVCLSIGNLLLLCLSSLKSLAFVLEHL